MSKFKDDLKSGKAALGIMIEEVTTPNIARILSACGFKYFIIDCEHGSFNHESVANIVSVARGTDIIPMVRVSEITKEAIFKPIEAGAMGILVPQIKTVDDAVRVVKEARYAPLGNRGISYMKVHDNFNNKSNPEHTEKQNDELMIILQIETKESVENIDEILSVKGIDAVLIGPNDLSQSYGILGQFDNPIMLDAIEKVVQASKKHGIISGIHIGDKKELVKWSKKGMRLLMWLTESGLMIQYGSQGFAEIQSELDKNGILMTNEKTY